jgi:anti-sigma regulatory factor (Ser/Thr protein kinase)
MSIGADRRYGPDEARNVRVTLAPDWTAAAAARQVVEGACRAWQLDHVLDVAQLVITELVSNVVRHAGTVMEISLTADGEALHLAVHDQEPTRPEPAASGNTMAESGRGLLVVAALTSDWEPRRPTTEKSSGRYSRHAFEILPEGQPL